MTIVQLKLEIGFVQNRQEIEEFSVNFSTDFIGSNLEDNWSESKKRTGYYEDSKKSKKIIKIQSKPELEERQN